MRASGVHLGVDPLGGASVAYWDAIGERYGLNLEVVNHDRRPDVPLHDRRLGRPDPHGPVVAVRDGAAWSALKDRFDVAFANDTDADRHGIVTPQRGPARAEPLPLRRDRLPLRQPPGLAGVGRRRQDARVEQHDRPRRGAARPAAHRGAGRLQVVRRRAHRRLDRLRAARRARARRSCAATARSGRRTRTASSPTCSPRRSPRGPGRTRASTTAR